MYKDGAILMGKGEKERILLPSMANRHGLIAGATGTGKTITLKVMAESFASMGVPVFLADIKGDLAGMPFKGKTNDKIKSRLDGMGIEDFEFDNFPVRFWDVYGEKGHPVRATISDVGPVMLARILDLNETQSGILNITFRVADENGWLLLDIKDLRAMLQYVSKNAKELSLKYGNITAQSVSAIMRSLLSLEDAGGNLFFGEPMLDVRDWMVKSYDGKGMINILHCEKLFTKPLLYSTFLLWMMSELYELLPEKGDCDKPEIVFFFDEAHLLFEDAPKALLQKIEQTVRLIRSKGVGVYFITQSPTDIPDSILAQLGNRVQHALRAYTPAEQKKVKVAADTFRANPNFSTFDAITELNTGEALVSFLDSKGAPGIVERATILPPQSRMGAIEDDERIGVMQSDGMGTKYDVAIDRESAYEIMNSITELETVQIESTAEAIKKNQNDIELTFEDVTELQKKIETEEAKRQKRYEKEQAARQKKAQKEAEKRKKQLEKLLTNAAGARTVTMINNTIKRPVTKNQTAVQKSINSAINSTMRTVGRQTSQNIVRGILGNLLK